LCVCCLFACLYVCRYASIVVTRERLILGCNEGGARARGTPSDRLQLVVFMFMHVCRPLDRHNPLSIPASGHPPPMIPSLWHSFLLWCVSAQDSESLLAASFILHVVIAALVLVALCVASAACCCCNYTVLLRKEQGVTRVHHLGRT